MVCTGLEPSGASGLMATSIVAGHSTQGTILGATVGKRRFNIVLIVPSHYDDDGYVIQWLRSMIPSNSLASVYGLLKGCADAQALGPDVAIEVEPYDEMN